MTTRYETMFSRCASERRLALMPFLMLGDPDLPTSAARIHSLVGAGADGLELGFPFSDPVADGPIIVAAANRARAAGVTPDDCFSQIAAIRAAHPELPIGLLVYANLVFARGVDRFYRDCADAGVDSVLVPDAPRHEIEPFREAAQSNDVAQVLILPPDANENAVADIGARGMGYTYVLGRTGVTGVHQDADAPLAGTIQALSKHGAPPAVVGFGIRDAAAILRCKAAGAAGAIVGSALVEAYSRGEDGAALVRKLREAGARP